MNLPNLITILRIALIPFFIIAVMYGYQYYAIGIFLVAALTDALDGFIARTFNMQTQVGTWLDPIADKLLLISSIVVMAVVGKVPLWLVILIVSRDVIILTGCVLIYFLYDQLAVRPSVLGKATTFTQLALVT
ncbi:MAG: CDP-alcohol phosphatidyltransferase family protein, partial [Nitrospirota bacterium]|nr:CDP-alcohol phosphatidyltransferase family protein [Nitrospirota bacterium]